MNNNTIDVKRGMEESSKYNFQDFTFRHYGELLDLAKSHYVFRSYEYYQKDENFIIWRHDVDLSLDYALELAKIEHAKGIKSTYFLHLHSEFYNLLEASSKVIVSKIGELGHEIGIHFDPHFYNITNESGISSPLNLEVNIFSSTFDIDVKSFSFHNPTASILECQKERYCGLINTYSTYFQKELAYCSDSNGYWRYERLGEVLKSRKYPRLQVLTHPEWWQEVARSPRERVINVIKQRSEFTQAGYDSGLVRFKRENVGA